MNRADDKTSSGYGVSDMMDTAATALTPPTSRSAGRIVAIDVARAVAMFGMVIAHYAWPDDSDGILDGIASSVDGRAMPLFVMLGGLGVTMLTSRSPHPDRALLIRAAILGPLGLVLQELTTFIAIILHYYSVFFVAAVVLRRLSTRVLAGLAIFIAVAGSWTYQFLAPQVTGYRQPSDLIDAPLNLGWSLLFEGFYPFFPVASFFIVGMILARLDLRSPKVALRLAIVGALTFAAVALTADPLVEALDVNVLAWQTDEAAFNLSRLLDDDGHSEMLAWLIAAMGSSVAIIGGSLLLTPKLGGWSRPLVSLGQLALTFYVFQAVLVRFTPHPSETDLGQEFLTLLPIYFGFMAFATLWKLRFRTGPLEAVLRLGSRSSPYRPRAENAG
ncbi:MAG: DUF418 domain-containing protein [Acidimicrobiales bacterium]